MGDVRDIRPADLPVRSERISRSHLMQKGAAAMTFMDLAALDLAFGLISAIPLAFSFAFNMRRFYRLVRDRIHPMLVEQGLREPDDGWVSSGIADPLTIHQPATRHSPRPADNIRRTPKDTTTRTPTPRPTIIRHDAAAHHVTDTVRRPGNVMRPLPHGPFFGVDENLAMEARRLYEANDLPTADAWIEDAGTRTDTRACRNAWRNETLQRFGLSHQPRHILQGINRRAWAIHTLHHTGPAEAYKRLRGSHRPAQLNEQPVPSPHHRIHPEPAKDVNRLHQTTDPHPTDGQRHRTRAHLRPTIRGLLQIMLYGGLHTAMADVPPVRLEL